MLPYAIGNWEQLPALTPALAIPEWVKNLKILIVDDEEYNRLLFKTILARWKVNFDEAADGLKALDLIKTTRYNLVFMDVRMPGMDGLKSTALIRDELKKSAVELPVIGISATNTDKDLQEYRLSGMSTFLHKPFTEKMLLEVILSVLEPAAEIYHADVTSTQALLTDSCKVNLSNLYHLADHDIPFVKQMLTRFIESTEQGLQEIQHAVDAGNIKAVMETAHKISAPCRHIGADELYIYLKAIEDQAQNHKNLPTLIKLYEDSNREFAVIRNILQEHIVKINA
jgi:CheY-like chemotaxis protein